MTCVVGVAASGRVWIGADSAGVAGLDLTIRKDEKVFRNGPFLIGFTTSFRMGQILRYSMTVPERPQTQDVFHFMATTFVDAVRNALKAAGFATKLNEVESAGTFLIGYGARLFMIASDYQVGEALCGYDACGCGQSVAVGAMHATGRAKMKPDSRVMSALLAAEAHSAGVRAPFTVMHT